MIGYSPLHKGYKCLDSTGKICIAQHVKFNESEFLFSELFPSNKPIQSVLFTQQIHTPLTFVPRTIVIQDGNIAQPFISSLARVARLDSSSSSSNQSSISSHLPSQVRQ